MRFFAVVFCAVVVGCCFVGCRNTIVGEGEGEGEGEQGVGEGEGEGEGDCAADPDAPVPAVSVRVDDAVSDIVLCDADVSVDDGADHFALVVVGSGAACVYEGAFDRPGEYVLTVAKAGYVTFTNPNAGVSGDPVCPSLPEGTREFDVSLNPL